MSVLTSTKPSVPGSFSVKYRRFALNLGWVALFFGSGISLPAAKPSEELRFAQVSLLYSDSLFSNVNRNDAKAAIKTWIETLGQRQGFELAVEIGFHANADEAAQRIQEKSVDVITCTSVEYLELAPAGGLIPLFVPAWNQASDDYVLISRRDRDIATLADLRGKSVTIYQTGAGLGSRWMDASLVAGGLGAADAFFGSSIEAVKPSSAVLPVFFGRFDAAVATRYGWETMKELNPQLGTQLQILAHSPSLPEAVICLHRNSRENPFRKDLIRGMEELDSDPHGRQILLLFKTDRMAPFEPGHLDGIRALTGASDGWVAPKGQNVAGNLPAGDPGT